MTDKPIIPFVYDPMGLDSFSSSNKQSLETNLENILTKAFKETFKYTDEEGNIHSDYVLGDRIAENFGKGAAHDLAEVIDDYVKNYIKSQLIQLTPKGTLMAGTNPVTGNASTLLSDIIIK